MARKSDPNTTPLLTKKQLLAMPESDYMNAAQLAFFRNRLKELETEILNNAGTTTENLRETQFVPDPADRATIEEEHALELRTRDRERKLLKKVQQSIAKIDAGDYGWCEASAWRACLRARQPRCRSKRRNGAKCGKSCTGIKRDSATRQIMAQPQ